MLVSEVIDRCYSEWLNPAGINRPAFDVLKLPLGMGINYLPNPTLLGDAGAPTDVPDGWSYATGGGAATGIIWRGVPMYTIDKTAGADYAQISSATIPVKPGEVWTVSGELMRASGTGDVALEVFSASGLGAFVTPTQNTAAFVRISATFTIPPGEIGASAGIVVKCTVKNNPALGEFRNIQLEKSATMSAFSNDDPLYGGTGYAPPFLFQTEGRVANVPPDSIIEIGSELMRTKTVTGASPTVSVTLDNAGRGYLETAVAAHAAGDVVFIDPKFPRINVFNALKNIIGSLYPSGVYRRTTNSAFNWQTLAAQALDAGVFDVLSMVVRVATNDERYTNPLQPNLHYRVLDQFSPPKLRMIMGGSTGQAVTAVVKKDFTLPTAETDDLDTLGVPVNLQSALPMAMAGWLLQGREIPRVQIEEIRRQLASQGIQVGSALNIGQTILHMFYNGKVENERRRLEELDHSSIVYSRT